MVRMQGPQEGQKDVTDAGRAVRDAGGNGDFLLPVFMHECGGVHVGIYMFVCIVHVGECMCSCVPVHVGSLWLVLGIPPPFFFLGFGGDGLRW